MSEQSQEITYRALPYDRDFETRHEAIGFAVLKRRELDGPIPQVQWMDEERRQTEERLSKIIDTASK